MKTITFTSAQVQNFIHNLDGVKKCLTKAAPISEIHEAIYKAILWLNENKLNQTN